MTDDRMDLDLMTDILDVLDRHGFARGDDEHVGRAGFLITTWPASTKAPRTARTGPPSHSRRTCRRPDPARARPPPSPRKTT